MCDSPENDHSQFTIHVIYPTRIKLNQINNMPDIIPTIDKCQFPYSFASGSSVSNEMYVIIPATPAIKIPTKTCGKNNPKINIPTEQIK